MFHLLLFLKSLARGLMYLAVQYLVTSGQKLLWRLNGIEHVISSTASPSAAGYERSVQVMKIAWRWKTFSLKPATPDDFLLLHDLFASPEVLKSRQVSLYCLTPDRAIFVWCPLHPDICSSSTSPFLYIAQYERAQMAYVMPLWAFHKFARELGDPQVPVIWLSSLGRCGSTLLTQMMESIPGTVSLSEPEPLTSIFILKQLGMVSADDCKVLVQSVVRVVCKGVSPDNAERIFVKTRGQSISEVADVFRSFPRMKHVYMYRDMPAWFQSVKGMMESDAVLTFLKRLTVDSDFFASGVSTEIRRHVFHIALLDPESKDLVYDVWPSLCSMGFAAIMLGCHLRVLQRLQRHGVRMRTLKYEDFMAGTEQTAGRLFEYLEIPLEHLSLAMTAMARDSQRDTFLSRESLKSRASLSQREILDINRALARFGIPSMNSELNLSDAI